MSAHDNPPPLALAPFPPCRQWRLSEPPSLLLLLLLLLLLPILLLLLPPPLLLPGAVCQARRDRSTGGGPGISQPHPCTNSSTGDGGWTLDTAVHHDHHHGACAGWSCCLLLWLVRPACYTCAVIAATPVCSNCCPCLFPAAHHWQQS